MVCANSNSACDEITERLLNVLQIGEIFRMYAKSYDTRKVSEDIKPICNMLKKGFCSPSLEFLYQFRVLVCTLNTAGSLARAQEYPEWLGRKSKRSRRNIWQSGSDNDAPAYNPKHFSHIFIDECVSAHETVSLISIAGKK